MAPLSSNLKSLHIFQPCLQIPQPPQIFANPYHKTRKVKTFACQTNPNLHQSSSTEKSSAELDNRKGKGPPKVGPPKFPSKDIKKKIAMVSFLGALGLVLSSRLHFFDGKNMTLNDRCAHAVPSQEVS
ncbi:hypothetical protein Fmac_014859 [Flemingia macrophylla]|uniref:Uncharacterized protein n=1 Tax=Flemingia macrophylla TaxID=520843 RepID=A0ABD1MCY7_9FABA